MSKEEILKEKHYTIQAMGIIHNMRLKALEQEKKEPGSVKNMPDTSYTLLNYLATCVPPEVAMPHNFEELDEYTASKKFNYTPPATGPAFGSEGAYKQSEK